MDEDADPDPTDRSQAVGNSPESVSEAIVREMADAVFVIDVERADDNVTFRFRRTNAAYRQWTGTSEDEIRGQTPRDRFGDEQGAAVAANYRRCVEQGATVEYEETRERPDGNAHWQTKLTPITDDGHVAQIVGVAREITEQQAKERRLQDRNRRLETVLETMSEAVFLKDTDGRYLLMNRAYRELVTGESQDGVGLTDADLFPPEVARQAREDDQQVIENGTLVEREETVPTARGDTVRLTRKSPVYDDGEVTGICGVSTDITDHKAYERTLEETKQRLDLALSGTKTGVWEWDLEADEVVWTASMERLFGIGPGTFEGTYDAFADRLHPDDLPALEDAIERAIDDGDSFKTEYRIQKGTAEYRWVEARAELVERDGARRLTGIATDITDRKERIERIELQSRAIEAANDGIAIVDGDEYIYLNRSHADIFGYEADELIGETWHSLYGETEQARIEAEVLPKLMEASEWRGETVGRTQDGTPLYQDLTLSQLDDGTLICTTRDITDRKEYELALEAAQEELRQIVDLVPDLIFAKNGAGEYLLANEATADAYGLTPEEVEGSDEADVLPNVDDSAEFRADDRDVIDSGESKEITEERLTTADGDTRVFKTTKIPYQRLGSGEDAVLGYARDVTDLKAYERTLERQRDDLTVLNQIVRHDVRNDLQLVLAYSDMLADYVEDGGKEYFRNIVEAGREAVEITHVAGEVTEALLRSETEYTPVNVRSVLNAQLEYVRASHDRALVSIDGALPDVEVLADDLLASVFRNVLTNAVVHNDTKCPEITVSATAGDAAVRIRVADNGPGIPDEQKDQIFEEGTKSLDSEGTGIGLYLVQTLVNRYGGTVEVADNDPDGTVFVIELRRCD